MSGQIAVLLQNQLTDQGPSYTCGMLARGMASGGLDVTIVTPRVRSFSVSPADVVEVLPRWTRSLPYRAVRPLARRTIEQVFLRIARRPTPRTQAAYIFPDAALQTIRDLKQENITVFREMINCHRGTAKTILDDAYKRLETFPAHGITDASVAAEQEALEAVDYIFCPSPKVEESLLDHGIPSQKLLRASYGWKPERFSGSNRALERSEGITAVFVGTICVRKGAHLLLDYWARSGVKGRLVLAGELEPIIRERCAGLLRREDVVVLNYFKDIGSIYRSADFFVLPTLEEGSPLVTYEACGAGLPVVTTPMGAGSLIRHNQEGFVIDPYDGLRWVEALRTLSDNICLRRSMANAVKLRARDFVWDDVADRRRKQLLDILCPGLAA